MIQSFTFCSCKISHAVLFSMAGERYSASQSVNLIRSWLEEDSEYDDTYCSIAESSDDKIEDVLVEDAAEADNSSSSSAE